jgi:hypothetical protein
MKLESFETQFQPVNTMPDMPHEYVRKQTCGNGWASTVTAAGSAGRQLQVLSDDERARFDVSCIINRAKVRPGPGCHPLARGQYRRQHRQPNQLWRAVLCRQASAFLSVSRANGRRAGFACCCKFEPRHSMERCHRCSSDGIPDWPTIARPVLSRWLRKRPSNAHLLHDLHTQRQSLSSMV